MTSFKENEGRSWWWMSTRERDGWASTTKVQRTIAFVITTFVVVFTVINGTIPAGLAELLGIYFGIAVAGRVGDRWIEEKKSEK
jgi:hypothetical protein